MGSEGRWSSLARRAVLLVACVASSACGHKRSFLWVDNVTEPPRPDSAEYRITAGDVLSVRVWNQETMSTPRTRVRDDGKISIPFLQDVEVAGMTTGELASRLAVKLKTYVVNPVVTVALEERRPVRIAVLGEVTHPGSYDIESGSGVLHALAAAGGLTDYAHRDGIYVLRYGYWADGNPEPARIRFRWEALAGGAPRASGFRLRTGDVVVVE